MFNYSNDKKKRRKTFPSRVHRRYLARKYFYRKRFQRRPAWAEVILNINNFFTRKICSSAINIRVIPRNIASYYPNISAVMIERERIARLPKCMVVKRVGHKIFLSFPHLPRDPLSGGGERATPYAEGIPYIPGPNVAEGRMIIIMVTVVT